MDIIMHFPSNNSIYLLKNIGVKYLVVHTKDMNISQWNHTYSEIGDHHNEIHLRKKFGTDYIYEINVSSSNIDLTDIRNYGCTGYYAHENWSGIQTFWMRSDATLALFSPENRTVNLTMHAQSFYRPRTMEVYLGEDRVASVAVPSTRFINTTIVISLMEGANIVRLHVPEGCERPCDIKELNNPDSRCLSIALQNVTVE